MRESLDNAQSELRRADHLLYVSLKYTRTVDVLKSIVDRLINAYDFIIEAILMNAQEKKEIESIPAIPRVRAELLQKTYPENETLNNYMTFYLLLRLISQAKFDRAREYRRHVTMTAHLEEGPIEVNIDIIGDYFHKSKEFVEFAENMIYGKNE